MGLRSQILEKVKLQIEDVTIANGYTVDVKTVTFENIKVNIHEYQDWELPAVQIIDTAGLYKHEFSRSLTNWNFVTELCMRTTEVLGTVNQLSLLNFMEDVVRAVMAKPKLDLSFVQHVKLFDHQTDIHSIAPNYIAIIGWTAMFYEPITRDNC